MALDAQQGNGYFESLIKLAEIKGTLFVKSIQKHAGRAKQKLLQNLGKVDRTADVIFDEHLTNFNHQQNNTTRLHKELSNYIHCMRSMQKASKSLMEAIANVHEPQSSDALHTQTKQIDSLWQDLLNKLDNQVLIPLNVYNAKFPEMRRKIEKRNRKLIDYDGQRHSFQRLQVSAAKRNDVKVTKGKIKVNMTKRHKQLEEARRTYEIFNAELYVEMPKLYESRILFFDTNLPKLFATQQVFHNKAEKVFTEMKMIVDNNATLNIDPDRASQVYI